MKKFLSLLLALLCVLSSALLVSCDDDGTPDGMKSATRAGEPFILYVPEGFTDNTASGISGAYYTQIESSLMVTARYYTPSDSEMTLDGYMSFCLESYESALEGFEITEDVAGDTLGGADARRIGYKMSVGGIDYEVAQISLRHKNDFVSLTFYATGEGMSAYADFISDIRANFTLAEKVEDTGDELVDKKTPEGMKIASSDVLEYRLYVPKSWICSSESGISEAYYPESERTNVTVTSYSPNGEEKGMSTEKYYKKCVEEYAKTVSGFALVGESENIKVAEKDAISFVYTAEYGGVVYKLRQVIFLATQYNLYYTFTYTATEQNFELHMEDFDAMLAAFTFR